MNYIAIYSKKIKRMKVLFLVFVVIVMNTIVYGDVLSKFPYKIIATTYFGNEWTTNFWSREHRYASADFDRIVNDGFNTLILCIPWREMQPDTYGEYNKDAINEMHSIINLAKEKGLYIMVRLGYTWDYYENESPFNRYILMWSDRQIKDAWYSYAKRMYEELSKHDNFIGGFITWEDFWDALVYNYGKDYAKIDDELLDLLINTQKVFDSLSMECRIHEEPLDDGTYFTHEKMYPCGNANFASLLLSFSMKQKYYTVINAENTLNMSRYIIDNFSISNKPVFIDQFLYTESTPGYEHVPVLDDINAYLKGMGSIFRDKTIGYGLWTYQDYIDNVLYNSEFALGDKGWKFINAYADNILDNKVVCIDTDGMIKQDISWKGFLSDKGIKFEARVVADKESDIEVSVCGQKKIVHVLVGDQVIKLDFENGTKDEIMIKSNQKVYMDDIKLYSYTITGGIYKVDGIEDKYLSGVRALNAELK